MENYFNLKAEHLEKEVLPVIQEKIKRLVEQEEGILNNIKKLRKRGEQQEGVKELPPSEQSQFQEFDSIENHDSVDLEQLISTDIDQ